MRFLTVKTFMVLTMLLAWGGVSTTARAEDSDGCARLVRPGQWKGKGSMFAVTGCCLFPARKNDHSIYRVTSQCAEAITISAGKRELLFHYVTGKRYKTEPEIHREKGQKLTIQYVLEVEDMEHFVVSLLVDSDTHPLAWGTRSTAFTFIESEASAPLDPCECEEALNAYIENLIADQKYWSDLYGNPEYWKRPPQLPEKYNWTAREYEGLITFLEGNEKGEVRPYDEAVADTIAWLESSSQPTEDAAAETGGLVGATTDNKTCATTMGDAPPGECFPGIWKDMTAYHEGVHVARCKEMRAAYKAHDFMSGKPAPTRYHVFMNDPENAGHEEVRAYEATVDWLSDWKSRNCSKK